MRGEIMFLVWCEGVWGESPSLTSHPLKLAVAAHHYIGYLCGVCSVFPFVVVSFMWVPAGCV